MVAVCEKSPAIACGWVLLLLIRVVPLSVERDGLGRAVAEPEKKLAILDKAARAGVLPKSGGKADSCDCDCGCKAILLPETDRLGWLCCCVVEVEVEVKFFPIMVKCTASRNACGNV